MFGKKISLFILPFIAIGTLQANDYFLNDPFGDDIFKEMDKIFERMHQRVEQRTQQWSDTTLIPDSNPVAVKSLLEDKGTHYEYNTQIKESQNSQIDISTENGILHLKVTTDTSKKEEQPHIQMQQHYVGMMHRSQALPNDVDAGSLKSEYKNGMLILTLQKTRSQKVPAVDEAEKKTPALLPETFKKQEKKDSNTTKMRVPHTNSHV